MPIFNPNFNPNPDGFIKPAEGIKGGKIQAVGFKFPPPILPAGATLTRAGNATYIDSTGLLVTAAANVARFSYNAVTLAYRGLMVEPAATNVILRSEEFENASWSKILAGGGTTPTVVANNTTAPNGTQTADEITFNNAGASGDNFSLLAQNPTVTAGTYTFSIWLRVASGTQLLYFRSGGIINSITLTSTWTRFSITSTLAANGTLVNHIGLRSSTNGFGTQTVLVQMWGAQLELGTIASSYIPTTNASASRAADVLTLNWSALGYVDETFVTRYGYENNVTLDVTTTPSGGLVTVPTSPTATRLVRASRL